MAKLINKTWYISETFSMAFKIVLLIASMAVASQASNTLWACRKYFKATQKVEKIIPGYYLEQTKFQFQNLANLFSLFNREGLSFNSSY